MKKKSLPIACFLLLGDISFDNRVLRHASCFKKLGFEVRIFCVNAKKKNKYDYLGFKIINLNFGNFFYIDQKKWQYFELNLINFAKNILEKFLAIFSFISQKLLPKSFYKKYCDHFLIFATKVKTSLLSGYFLFARLVKTVFRILISLINSLFDYYWLFKNNFVMSKTAKILIKEKAMVYIANDLPALRDCYLAARDNKAMLVYDSHELFMESFSAKKFSNKSLSERVFRYIKGFLMSYQERRLMAKTDLNMTVNLPIARILQKKYSLFKRPMVVRSLFEYQPSKKSTIFHKMFKLNKKQKVILYQGLIAKDRGMEVILRVVKKMGNNFVAVFLGYGKFEKDLAKLIEKLKMTKQAFILPPVAKDKLIKYTASADIGCLLRRKDFVKNWDLSLPNKLFEYIMAGVPIVATDLLEVTKIIKKENIGVIVNDPTSVLEISRAMKKILMPKNWQTYHLNCLRSAKKYNWEKEEKKLLKIYKKLF